MSCHRSRALALGAALALAQPAAALARPAAIVVDGQLDSGYGSALVTQTTQTGLANGQIVGDNNVNDLNFASGSELDQAYAFIADGALHLFLTGNVAMMLKGSQAGTVGHILDVFLDTGPGGQNALNGLGVGNPLNGLTFDAGFEADHLFEFWGSAIGGPGGTPIWAAYYQAIPTQGGTSLVWLGDGTAGGPGTLSGGTNPDGVLVTIDNHNVAGVTFGCDAASGAGVTTGVEWAIPLAAIGNPSGCVKITAIVRDPGTATVSNQVLAPLPPGTCPPGPASTLNFALFAGDQFFSVCPTASAGPPATGARFALLATGPNPTRGDRLQVSFELPDARPAQLALLDCAGRLVRDVAVSAPGGGVGHADLAAAGRVTPGVYWLRLTQGGSAAARKLCVVR